MARIKYYDSETQSWEYADSGVGGGSATLPENVVTCDLEGSASSEEVVPVNADTLGGAPASDYTRYYFTAFLSDSFTFPVNLTKIPLTCGLNYGDFFEIQDGIIVCKKKCIAHINVQGYVNKGFTSGDFYGIALWKNGSLWTRNYTYAHSNNSFSILPISAIVEAEVGDEFQILGSNAMGERGTLLNGEKSTHVDILVIRDLSMEVTT